MFELTPKERARLTAFLSKLVRTPSLSCQEGKVAEHLVQELQAVGVTDVRIDRIGNVVARLGTPGRGPMLLYNGHMDTVDVTDRAAWHHDPWMGVVEDGSLYFCIYLSKSKFSSDYILRTNFLNSLPGPMTSLCYLFKSLAEILTGNSHFLSLTHTFGKGS